MDSKSGSATPNERFRSSDMAAEEQLKAQTVGLVHLDDFRKRRAEALDSDAASSGPASPIGSEEVKFATKKRKAAKKGVLSFGDDEGDESSVTQSTKTTPRSQTPASRQASVGVEDRPKKLAANAGVGFIAKSKTKSALAREAQLKETLRREFLATQARVKATEFQMPFVFYDGADSPGGVCRMKKGDQVWRFLDKARKVGAGQAGGMKQWARVSVDDLMLVKDDLIIPHHLELYFFMLNKVKGFDGAELFPYSADLTAGSPDTVDNSVPSGLNIPGQQPEEKSNVSTVHADAALEGFGDDPTLTKVVDRRWYERNKHIFPASIWQDLDPSKDYSTMIRKDTSGNAFFARN
ncbi:FAM50 family protein [Sphaceloma murrayae]|uniref:FAM50 family protein n=1 Tax=Sphaceloma murrayae TaxID=2082308 RepID=A0A2K1QV43_9PEZI|nr:FAM50 family protein [Sphaceloma murrayae]